MKMRQTTERRISAITRLVLVAAILLANLILVLFLSYFLQNQVAFLFILLQIVGVVVTVCVFGKKGSVTYKMAWAVTILALPVAGLIMYVLWGSDNKKRKGLINAAPAIPCKSHEISHSLSSADKLGESFPAWRRCALFLHKYDFPLCRNTEVTYFSTGKSLFENIIERMKIAERFIFLEYFILAEGQLWDQIFSILKEKATQGVEVKIIFDDFGSMTRMSGETVEAMRRCGIEVHVFNPVHRYVNRLYFNYRDHRKLCCIDGEVAYTGGANIADEYVGLVERFGHWKDCGVALEGEGAWGLTRLFLHMWECVGGTLQNEHDYYRPLGTFRSEGWCQPFCDGPLNNPENPAEDLYLQTITSAREFVYITTPYLAIEEAMVKTLCIAADSGVDVRLLLPGIPDHKYTYLAAGAYFDELLSHGVRIYEYVPGFLHSKLLVADGEMGIIGTVNMDYRSFQLHYECGTVLYAMSAVEHMLRDIRFTMEQSREISLKKWRKRSVFRRLAENMLRIFTIWM